MRLAVRLHKFVPEVLAMSMAEFRLWLAYDRIDPFGSERDDMRAAIVAATVANSVGAAVGSKRRMDVADFMPDFAALEERQRVTDLRVKFGLFVQAHNGEADS